MLVISLRTLLAQPLLWVRLKNMVTRQRFDWLSIDESRLLPVSIPSMPLSLKVMLVGERESLADFQKWNQSFALRRSTVSMKTLCSLLTPRR